MEAGEAPRGTIIPRGKVTMKTEEIVGKLGPWLAKHRRPAWKPVIENGDGPATGSKFSGTPWVGPDAPWPECGLCKQPLQLFLQLNLDDLPAELGQCFGTGLLQLFYCTHYECQSEGGWEPFADDLSRLRVVHPQGESLKTSVPQQGGYFPAKQIVGWDRFVDLPDPEEHRELGLRYDYEENGETLLECKELGLVFNHIRDGMLAENIASSEPGDKLAGWPRWVQFVDYPDCPRCGRRMVLVFQVDSEDNVPFMFGDAGCGHITQCPEHKEVVAFGWACC
jgi:uncharacterized protein YwqG